MHAFSRIVAKWTGHELNTIGTLSEKRKKKSPKTYNRKKKEEEKKKESQQLLLKDMSLYPIRMDERTQTKNAEMNV